jgi:hypothetical protein
MSSTGGFERAEDIVAATETLCVLDLTALPDERIARVLQSARRCTAGWTTTPDPHGGRPLWTVPHLLDPSRARRRNHRHHPHELIARAEAAAHEAGRPKRHRTRRLIFINADTEAPDTERCSSATDVLRALLSDKSRAPGVVKHRALHLEVRYGVRGPG